LLVTIASDGNGVIEITNNIQPRQITGTTEDLEAGIDNIVNKYELLSERKVQITETNQQRTIQLPLLETKKAEVTL
jgi:two-component system, LytTR family, sensor kinase